MITINTMKQSKYIGLIKNEITNFIRFKFYFSTLLHSGVSLILGLQVLFMETEYILIRL